MAEVKNYNIALLPGDGIGPEVVDAARSVMNTVNDGLGLSMTYSEFDVGAEAYRRTGTSISTDAMEAVGHADAVLLGAAGLPDVRMPDGTEATPQIDIREAYGLFASLRPAIRFEGVPSRVESTGTNLMVIRETTEGLFAGRRDEVKESDLESSDRLTITRETSERLFRLAFEQARQRRDTQNTRGKVTLLDKSNVLRSNALLRKVFYEIAEEHPDVEAESIYIDAGTMMLVTQPERFDVVVTENVFGDIASEVAAGVVGGLGVVPSGDVSNDHGVFQPCHGSAPDIAGHNVANPIATILSAAMLYEWLGTRNEDDRCLRAAAKIRHAVAAVVKSGPKTKDIGGTASTSEVVDSMIASLSSD